MNELEIYTYIIYKTQIYVRFPSFNNNHYFISIPNILNSFYLHEYINIDAIL